MDPEEVKQRLDSMRKELEMKRQQLERHKSRKRALEELSKGRGPGINRLRVHPLLKIPPPPLIVPRRDFDSDETVGGFVEEFLLSGVLGSTPGSSLRRSPVLTSGRKSKEVKVAPQLRLHKETLPLVDSKPTKAEREEIASQASQESGTSSFSISPILSTRNRRVNRLSLVQAKVPARLSLSGKRTYSDNISNTSESPFTTSKSPSWTSLRPPTTGRETIDKNSDATAKPGVLSSLQSRPTLTASRTSDATIKHVDSTVITTQASVVTSKHSNNKAGTKHIATKHAENTLNASRTSDISSKHVNTDAVISQTSGAAVKRVGSKANATKMDDTTWKHDETAQTSDRTSEEQRDDNSKERRDSRSRTTTKASHTAWKHGDSKAATHDIENVDVSSPKHLQTLPSSSPVLFAKPRSKKPESKQRHSDETLSVKNKDNKSSSPVLGRKNKNRARSSSEKRCKCEQSGEVAMSDLLGTASPSQKHDIAEDSVTQKESKENEVICVNSGGIKAKRHPLTESNIESTESNVESTESNVKSQLCAVIDSSSIKAKRHPLTESNVESTESKVPLCAKSDGSSLKAKCSNLSESNVESQLCDVINDSSADVVASGPRLKLTQGTTLDANLDQGILTVVQQGLVSHWRHNQWSRASNEIERKSHPGPVLRGFLSSSRCVACCELWPQGALTAEMYALDLGDNSASRHSLQLESCGEAECFAMVTEGSTVLVAGGATVRRFTLSEELDRVSSNQTLATDQAIESLHRVEGCPHVVAGWCNSQCLFVWNLESGILLRRLTLGSNPDTGISQTPTGLLWCADEEGFLFTLLRTSDSEVKLWATNLMTRRSKELKTYRSPPNLDKLLAARCNRGCVLSTYTNGLVMWDLTSGVVTATTKTERQPRLANRRAILVGKHSVDIVEV